MPSRGCMTGMTITRRLRVMRGALTLFLATPLFLLYQREINAWGVQRNQTGLRIGQRQNHQYTGSGTGLGGGRGSGVRIGLNKSTNRNLSSSLAINPTSASSTLPTAAPPPPPLLPPIDSSKLYVGLVVPYKSFAVRDYNKAVSIAKSSIMKATRGPQLSSFKSYDLQVKMSMKQLTPSPTGE
ncbi:hypothetical protein O3M35_013261 [Rhynocoris fuscipes]|uniref:Uncharacterized protein n=1 Tax=Rhynocoris fuscipes TaxID=488301 RepID=A0AAW1CE29_9HEMI